ncbi:MAG: ComEA family DNA-binding protein [Planctomycetota bacterium]
MTSNMAGDSRIGQTAFMTERIQCAAFFIVVSVCMVLGVFFSSVKFLSVSSGVSIQTEPRVNPNHAPLASLVRLPGVGISKAASIIEYRESLASIQPGSVAFCSSDDLEEVPGIGPKTAERISVWLRFD